jgi:hypothetical protein
MLFLLGCDHHRHHHDPHHHQHEDLPLVRSCFQSLIFHGNCCTCLAATIVPKCVGRVEMLAKMGQPRQRIVFHTNKVLCLLYDTYVLLLVLYVSRGRSRVVVTISSSAMTFFFFSDSSRNSTRHQQCRIVIPCKGIVNAHAFPFFDDVRHSCRLVVGVVAVFHWRFYHSQALASFACGLLPCAGFFQFRSAVPCLCIHPNSRHDNHESDIARFITQSGIFAP